MISLITFIIGRSLAFTFSEEIGFNPKIHFFLILLEGINLKGKKSIGVLVFIKIQAFKHKSMVFRISKFS